MIKQKSAAILKVCLFALALAYILVGDEKTAFANMDNFIEKVRGDHGVNVLYVNDPEVIELAKGQTLKINITLYPSTYIFIASGDSEAKVIDIRLYDKNGKEVRKDDGEFHRTRDTYGIFTASGVGVYSVKIMLEETAEGSDSAWIAWASGEMDGSYGLE